MTEVDSFWRWLIFKDRDGDRGLSNVINWWILFHSGLAIIASAVTTVSVADLTTKVAVPGAAILVGLSFAWAGRSASLFQDKSFSEFIIRDGAPITGYLYSFQLAVLSVLIFLGAVFLIYSGGLGFSSGNYKTDIFLNRFWIFFLGSLALRECWGSIYFVNKLTIQYYAVRTEELNQPDK